MWEVTLLANSFQVRARYALAAYVQSTRIPRNNRKFFQHLHRMLARGTAVVGASTLVAEAAAAGGFESEFE